MEFHRKLFHVVIALSDFQDLRFFNLVVFDMPGICMVCGLMVLTIKVIHL